MKCRYKFQIFVFLMLVFVINSTMGGRGRGSGGRSRSRGTSSSGGGSGGGFFSRIFGGGSKTSSTGSGSNSNSGTHSNPGSYSNSGSYPKQTYSSGTHNTNTNYGWNTGGNKYNSGSNSGHGHYYNSPSSSTNWGGTSSYNSPSYHQSQNTFGNFHPVGSGVAPSYHFARSTSYVPIYIPSHHTYYHHHHNTNNEQSSTTATDNNPPPPPSEPVVYKEEESSYGDKSAAETMIVGFNNMIVYGVYANDKHYVITVNEDLDEDINDIPEKFLHLEDSSLYEVVTLKPTTTTTTTSTTTEMNLDDIFRDFHFGLDVNSNEESKTNDWNGRNEIAWTDADVSFPTEIHKVYDEQQTSEAINDKAEDVLDLYFGDIILR